jgi:hypothetical protein
MTSQPFCEKVAILTLNDSIITVTKVLTFRLLIYCPMKAETTAASVYTKNVYYASLILIGFYGLKNHPKTCSL